MANIRSLHDSKGKESISDSEEGTSSFAGGHRSGIAIHNPKDKPKTLKVYLYEDGFKLEESDFCPLTTNERSIFILKLQQGIVPDPLHSLVPNGTDHIPVELIEIHSSFKDSGHGKGIVPDRAVDTSSQLYSGQGTSLSSVSMVNPVLSHSGIPHPVLNDQLSRSVIQIRLPGGIRVTRTFNEASRGTVIREIISSGLTGVSSSAVILSSGFPPKPISSDDLTEKTIKELGLCNSVVNVSVSSNFA